MGASYSINRTTDDMFEELSLYTSGLLKSLSWQEMTWPSMSLYTGKIFTNTYKNAFKKIMIEDLWLPYFCISANLSLHKEAIHTKGSLWRSIRASTSLPGLVPPVVFDSELHVDGGVLNNLPTDIMRNKIGEMGLLIAVDLFQQGETIKKKYGFEPYVSLIEILLGKLKLSSYKDYPSFSEVLLESLLLGSSSRNIENLRIADIRIKPDLAGYKLTKLKPGQKEELVEKGAKQATLELDKFFENNG